MADERERALFYADRDLTPKQAVELAGRELAVTGRPARRRPRPAGRLLLAGVVTVGLLVAPGTSPAHPLGNFSISQYAGIRVGPDSVTLRYLVDMAEIPTFQEIQETGIVPEPDHPGHASYLRRKAETLKEGLRLEVDGRRLRLDVRATELLFPPGAGGLPTLKLGVVYRAKLPGTASGGPAHLLYRDENFPDRAGWKEIIAVAERGVTLTASSVPGTDRSRELADYPTDLLNSPPQDREARLTLTREAAPAPAASTRTDGGAPDRRTPGGPPPVTARPPAAPPAAPPSAEGRTEAPPGLGLRANRQATPRDAFTDLMTTKQLGFGIVAFALAVATGLGALHALEPGHGKTIVAAYLVGSRGTAWHACVLGLVVTASHTAGVYLLGAVTLYASRYVVPERIYPWLGVVSGLAIAGLGFSLFLRRYADPGYGHGHAHDHPHDHPHGPHDHGAGRHSHGPDAAEAGHHAHSPPEPRGAVSLPGLVTLGLAGGIVPCPAALVVLLSALALNRVALGLLLIVAFSVGLAAVLIAIGVLMVHARRFMTRFQADGPLIQRWLPLTSSAIITLLGVAVVVQTLVAAGILRLRL